MIRKLTLLTGALLAIFFLDFDAQAQTLDVWPGDANNDGIVDMQDVYYVGVAANTQGPPRDTISNDWRNIPAFPWGVVHSDSTDFAYSDCDGNGFIIDSDLLAIEQNYLLTHGVVDTPVYLIGAPGDAPMFFTGLPDTMFEGQSITLPLHLGDSIIPVDSFFAISFSILYDTTLIEPQTLSASLVNNFPTPVINPLFFQRNIDTLGRLDIAVSLKALTGGGNVNAIQVADAFVNVSFIIEDNLIGKNGAPLPLSFTFANIKLLDGFGMEYAVYAQDATIPLKKLTNGIQDKSTTADIQVYPNPAQNRLTLESPVAVQQVQLFDVAGRLVWQQQQLEAGKHTLMLNDMDKGLYILHIQVGDGMLVKKILIEK